jgi:multifunctional methyltransferase subunit TRM112
MPSQATTSTTVDDGVGGETQKEEERSASQLARDLHRVLVETTVREGRLVCGACGHEYEVMEGIANFLLPAHLV